MWTDLLTFSMLLILNPLKWINSMKSSHLPSSTQNELTYSCTRPLRDSLIFVISESTLISQDLVFSSVLSIPLPRRTSSVRLFVPSLMLSSLEMERMWSHETTSPSKSGILETQESPSRQWRCVTSLNPNYATCMRMKGSMTNLNWKCLHALSILWQGAMETSSIWLIETSPRMWH